jgi:AcrR family transcriptional regulator
MPTASIWTRETAEKPAGLSREAIVRAAIKLADEEGPDAVSIRRIAAELKARPMSLYSFIERKDDLFDLMVDEIAGEALLGDELPQDWREALCAIAERTRAVALRHPWIISAYGRIAGVGPNGVRHIDESLAAIAQLDVSDERRHAILTAVDTYALGHVTRELLERRRGLDDPASVERVIDPADVPHVAEHGLGTADGAVSCREGLEWLLDGIVASLR